MEPARPGGVGISRLARTTSFRLMLSYVALFVVSVGILFIAVSWAVSNATRQQVDTDVADEIRELTRAAGSLKLAAVRRTIAEYAARPDDRMHYLLQNAAGKVVFGDLPPMAPRFGRQTLRLNGMRWPIRGGGMKLPNGYLFVGEDEFEAPHLRVALRDSFLLTVSLALTLALSGGFLISLGILGRIEAVSRTGRAIMAGDLRQRLPLRGTDDELDQLSHVVNQMLDRIEALMADVKRVSTGIAHDLRTPLTRMRQRLELAENANTATDLRAALGQSIGDIESILTTFTALLRIGQIEAGSRRAGFTEVNLGALVAGLAETFQPVAEEQGQTLFWDKGLSGPNVLGDPDLLTQLLVNLIENAIRHCPSGTRIAVGVSRSGSMLDLVVADDGPGLPEEIAAQWRDRERTPATRVAIGHGFGLSMVMAIAHLHNARVDFRDSGPGLRVVVSFPATAPTGRLGGAT